MILDVACCYLWLFSLYININIGKKKLLNVRLAGDHLCGEIAVHLAVAVGVCYGVFLHCPFSHEILDLIESDSEGFPTYSYM